MDARPNAPQIARAYTAGENTWCLLDTLHRHLEKKAGSPEFSLVDQSEELEALITVVRRRYSEAAGRLAEAFVRGFEAGSFELPSYYRQTQVFETSVASQLPGKRVAYILVGALRNELAHELVGLLDKEFETGLEMVTGTLPAVAM